MNAAKLDVSDGTDNRELVFRAEAPVDAFDLHHELRHRATIAPHRLRAASGCARDIRLTHDRKLERSSRCSFYSRSVGYAICGTNAATAASRQLGQGDQFRSVQLLDAHRSERLRSSIADLR